MDVLSGKGIGMESNHFMACSYQQMPIAIVFANFSRILMSGLSCGSLLPSPRAVLTEDLPYVHWAIQDSLHQAQEAYLGVLDNFSNRPLAFQLIPQVNAIEVRLKPSIRAGTLAPILQRLHLDAAFAGSVWQLLAAISMKPSNKCCTTLCATVIAMFRLIIFNLLESMQERMQALQQTRESQRYLQK